MNILVTGGAGYIGSHTTVELLGAGHQVVIIDNLSNSSPESIHRIEQITGKKVAFYHNDLLDKSALDKVFQGNKLDAVIHFAGLKAVGESVSKPLMYYANNLISTINLLEAMEKHGVKNLVFSSSATVYGNPDRLPITEDMPKSATNPYGQTKLMIEQILEDTVKAGGDWCITSLRYFNPIGAHESGLIGEAPGGIPNNVLPLISQTASGRLSQFKVLGNNYPTRDGTGTRDYIHVVDLAGAHLAALTHIHHPNEYKAYNIGTGHDTSVLELLHEFEKACGKPIKYTVADRRPGDIAACYADPSLANHELGWKAKLSVADACQSAWKWQSHNPNGYAEPTD